MRTSIKLLLWMLPCAYAGSTVFIPFFTNSSLNKAKTYTKHSKTIHHEHEHETHPEPITKTFNAAMAAEQLNSIPFVQELSRCKDTANETYYQEEAIHSHLPTRRPIDSRNIPYTYPTEEHKDSCPSGRDALSSSTKYTVVEYVGNLWFMKQTGLRFREKIRIQSIQDGQACVECITSYQSTSRKNQKKMDETEAVSLLSSPSSLIESDQNHGGKWVDCSKVVCTFTERKGRHHSPLTSMSGGGLGATSDSYQNGDTASKGSSTGRALGLDMNVESELLLRIPLISLARGAVNQKISSTFQKAAESHLKKHLCRNAAFEVGASDMYDAAQMDSEI